MYRTIFGGFPGSNVCKSQNLFFFFQVEEGRQLASRAWTPPLPVWLAHPKLSPCTRGSTYVYKTVKTTTLLGLACTLEPSRMSRKASYRPTDIFINNATSPASALPSTSPHYQASTDSTPRTPTIQVQGAYERMQQTSSHRRSGRCAAEKHAKCKQECSDQSHQTDRAWTSAPCHRARRRLGRPVWSPDQTSERPHQSFKPQRPPLRKKLSMQINVDATSAKKKKTSAKDAEGQQHLHRTHISCLCLLQGRRRISVYIFFFFVPCAAADLAATQSGPPGRQAAWRLGDA